MVDGAGEVYGAGMAGAGMAGAAITSAGVVYFESESEKKRKVYICFAFTLMTMKTLLAHVISGGGSM